MFAVWRVKNKTIYVETNYSWALSKIRFYLKRFAAFKIDLNACIPSCRFSISWIWWTAILRSSDVGNGGAFAAEKVAVVIETAGGQVE